MSLSGYQNTFLWVGLKLIKLTGGSISMKLLRRSKVVIGIIYKTKDTVSVGIYTSLTIIILIHIKFFKPRNQHKIIFSSDRLEWDLHRAVVRWLVCLYDP